MKIKSIILVMVLIFSLVFVSNSFSQDKTIIDPNETITFVWDANTETNLKGYKLYYAPTRADIDDVLAFQTNPNVTKVDVNIDETMTQVTIEPLPENGNYYFCLTAYNVHGNESEPSDAMCCYILVDYPPETPDRPKGFGCLPII